MRDSRGDKIRLLHIRDAIDTILEYTKGYDFESFETDQKTYDATCRQLEIIGEASNHLSETFLETHAEMPWAQIIAFRNVLIHQYFGLDERSIWDIVKNNIPMLKTQILLAIDTL